MQGSRGEQRLNELSSPGRHATVGRLLQELGNSTSCQSPRTFSTQAGRVPFLHCSLAFPPWKLRLQSASWFSLLCLIGIRPPAHQPEALSSSAPPAIPGRPLSPPKAFPAWIASIAYSHVSDSFSELSAILQPEGSSRVKR